MIENILLDTNIVSFILKKDSRAKLYAKHLEGRRLCISFMSAAELYQWSIERRWGRRRIRELQQRVQSYLVFPYDDEMAWEWARAMSIKGHPVAVDDAWIAATALRYGLSLVTHNPKHFKHIPGLKIITEAE